MSETKKKIIISAYDCSPDHGSEAGLGWNWVMAAANSDFFSKVFVLTIERYKSNIEKYVFIHPDEMKNVEFVFVPLPLGKLKRLNQRFKYIIWQRKIGKVAKEICDVNDIAFVQHATWATCVLPSYLYKAGVPFVYGPVGGGERIPKIVNLQISYRDRFVENVRNWIADVSIHLPPNNKAFKKAEIIYATTEETANLIPSRFRNKVQLMQSIGISGEDIDQIDVGKKYLDSDKNRFTVLLAARMLYWKGIDIAISVFKRLFEMDPSIHLKIVGGGTADRIQRYKAQMDGYLNIDYLGAVSFDEMKALYNGSDILLNCSLHDSGCMVILEAMQQGLPVVAINTGGPKVLMSDDCCVRIKPDSVDNMVEQICREIIGLKENPERLVEMSEKALIRANDFQFGKKYDSMMEIF